MISRTSLQAAVFAVLAAAAFIGATGQTSHVTAPVAATASATAVATATLPTVVITAKRLPA